MVVGFFEGVAAMAKERKLKLWQKLLLLLLLVVGGAIFSSTMWRSGRLYSFGLGFWGPNGHDGIWHLSLMNQVVKKIPPDNPVFAGEVLRNYHWGFDLLAGWIVRLSPFSSLDVYFRILPITFAILIGFLSFYLGKLITKRVWVGFWFAFLNFFAGSFGWVVTLLREGKIGGESLFWSMQSISTLVNPPYALSLIFLLLGISLLLKTKKWSWKRIMIIGTIFGLTINIKAYGGLIGLVGLFGYSLLELKRGNRNPFWLFLVATFLSGGIFLTTNRWGVSLFNFKPFWLVNTMIEAPDRLYLPRLALARYYLLSYGWGPKLIFIELVSLALFLIGNLGTRLLGLIELVKKIWFRRIESFDLFLIFGMLSGLLPALLFVQKGTVWNTIQFFYYFLFFSNFYLALFLARLTEDKKLMKKFFLALILLLTLPTTVSTLKSYLSFPAPASISGYELESLEFLKNQPDGVVLTFPYNRFKKSKLTNPLPLYLYESTAYVSAFSGKITFLEDEMNLTIMGYPWQERKKEVEKFFSSRDKIWARGFLLNNKIDYIYLVDEQKLPLQAGDLGVKVIFNNGQVRIYRVLR